MCCAMSLRVKFASHRLLVQIVCLFHVGPHQFVYAPRGLHRDVAHF